MIAVVRKWPLRCQNCITLYPFKIQTCMLYRFKLHGMYFSDKFNQNFTEMAHLLKTTRARAKIPGNLLLIYKLLILCLYGN